MNIYNNLGFIEKSIRNEKGMTLDNVSNDLNLSKAFLSYAEHGKKKLKEDTFIAFLNCYQIDFDFDLSLVNEVRDLLDELVMALAYRNRKQEHETAQLIIKNRKKYKHSYGCIYLPLIDVFLTIHTVPSKITSEQSKAFDEAESYMQLYSADEKAIYTFLKAYDAKKKKKNNLSIQLYYEALKLMDGRRWPQLEGIIKMNLANMLLISTSYFEAYEVVREAHDIMVRHSNYIRALICQNNMSSYLIHMQCCDAAEEISNKILVSKETFSNPLIYDYAVSVMLLTLTLGEKFEKAIRFSESHRRPFVNGFISNFCLIPYCYYRVGKSDECLREIRELSKERPTADDKALFSLLKAIIKQDRQGVEKEKKRMEKTCCRQYNWIMLMVLYQLMIHYYTSENEYELLADAYAKQSMVLKHKLPLLKE